MAQLPLHYVIYVRICEDFLRVTHVLYLCFICSMNIMISVYIFADIHMYICIFTYAFSHMYANVCIIIVFHRGNTLEHHFWASQLWHRSVHSRICFEPQQTLQEGPPATSPSEVPKLMGSQHFWSRSPNYFDVPQTSQSLRV